MVGTCTFIRVLKIWRLGIFYQALFGKWIWRIWGEICKFVQNMLVCGGIEFEGRLLCVRSLEENSAMLEGTYETGDWEWYRGLI